MSFDNYHKFSPVKMGVSVLLAIAMSTSVPVLANQDSLGSLFGRKQSKVLSVNQAFKVNAVQKDGALVVSFAITPEHYIYKEKLTAVLPDGVSSGQWQFSTTPNTVDDPQFGKVAVFESDVVASLSLTNQGDEIKDVPITIKWQGCAKAGLCYPPQSIATTISLPAQSKAESTVKTDKHPVPAKEPTPAKVNEKGEPAVKAVNPAIVKAVPAKDEPAQVPTDKQGADKLSVGSADLPSGKTIVSTPETVSADVSLSKTASVPEVVSEMASESMLASASQTAVPTQTNTTTINHTLDKDSDPFGIDKHPVLALFLLFLAGLLLSLTPCVYPMIPIVANIVARQNQVSTKKGLALSVSYGVGVASAYGLLGALVAWFGQSIGLVGYLQNPYVLGVFALIFALLALAMFDVIKIGLPSVISNALQSKSQSADGKLGSVGGSFMAGALSALVVSPCVSLPMAGALTAVSASGSAIFGFLALFMLGLGLSLPLMVVGAVQGKFMPKAGVWMNAVKEFCGFLLLAVSLGLLERVLLSPVILGVWALWFALVALWLWRLVKLPARALSLLVGVWSGCLMLGMAMGQTDPLEPLAKITAQPSAVSTQHKADLKITTLAELDDILANHDKVLVDIVADWCIECRIIERELLSDRPTALADYQVVKLDITDTNEHSQAVLARYNLVGPPALLLYKQGQLFEVLLGKVDRADFERALAN